MLRRGSERSHPVHSGLSGRGLSCNTASGAAGVLHQQGGAGGSVGGWDQPLLCGQNADNGIRSNPGRLNNHASCGGVLDITTLACKKQTVLLFW